MTSIRPNNQLYNYTYMTNINDLRNIKKEKTYNVNSLSGILINNPNFSKFSYILKLAQLDGIYNDPQANFTLFVSDDNSLSTLDDGFFINMDMSTARNIIKTCTINNRITGSLLEDSPISLYITLCNPNKLYISNINNITYINNNIKVIKKNIITNNGIIHITDSLILPSIIL